MNSVSWLIYAAQVSDNARTMSGVALTILGVGGIFGVAFGPLLMMDFEDQVKAAVKALIGPVMTVAFLSSAVLLVAPSKSTFMLIAASEVGETVLASKEVQDIGGEAGALASDSLKLLRKYVNEQLGEGEAK